jgi:large subunit ribosomal protein L23
MKYNPYQIIVSPVMTEGVFDLLEAENKLVFVVHREATKKQIKQAVEELFEVKVRSLNTQIQPGNIKRAYVRLYEDYTAMDVAMTLGMF